MSQLRDLLDELRALRLRPADWDLLDGLLAELEDGAPGAADRVRQAVFESRVRGRLGGGRQAPAVGPTKQVSALPWVGLVCALALFGVGGLLGGGVVLLGVAALSLFVFVVAMAGSRVAHRSGGDADDEPAPTPIPASVQARIDRITPA